MKSAEKLDYSKLLGFAGVGGEIASGVDFRDETVGARLGAKVGQEQNEPAKQPE